MATVIDIDEAINSLRDLLWHHEEGRISDQEFYSAMTGCAVFRTEIEILASGDICGKSVPCVGLNCLLNAANIRLDQAAA